MALQSRQSSRDTGADRLCAELISRIEADRREPDKILCHLAWARRILDDRQWTREQAALDAADGDG